MDVDITDTLERILSFTDNIKSFKEEFGDSIEIFLTEPMYYMASTFALFQIGECIKSIESWLKKSNTFQNWDEICRFSDLIDHEYQKVSNEMVWGMIEKKS